MNSRRFVLSLLMVGTMLVAAMSLSIGASRAQDDDNGVETLFSVNLEDGQYPIAPAFVRLLRITMAGGSNSPLHTHPGPEFGLILSLIHI